MRFLRPESVDHLSRAIILSVIARERWILGRRELARAPAGDPGIGKIQASGTKPEQLRFVEELEADEGYQHEVHVQYGVLSLIPDEYREFMYQILDDPIGASRQKDEKFDFLVRSVSEELAEIIDGLLWARGIERVREGKTA